MYIADFSVSSLKTFDLSELPENRTGAIFSSFTLKGILSGMLMALAYNFVVIVS